MVCAELLSVLGHTCDMAASAAEGVQLAQTGTYDAVLLDIELPDASGLDVVKQLRALPGYADLTIAAVSAHALQSYREATHVFLDLPRAMDFLEQARSLKWHLVPVPVISLKLRRSIASIHAKLTELGLTAPPGA